MEWFKEAERTQLEIGYWGWESAEHARRRVIAALYKPMDQAHCLADLLTDQLSVELLGIPWLGIEDHRRRALISDYLVAAAEGVEASVFDMLLCSRAWSHQFKGDAATELARRFKLGSRENVTPLDDLLLLKVDRELASTFVALGSALDRLAICTAGICALPIGLRRAGWPSTSREAARLMALGDPKPTASVLESIEFPVDQKHFGPAGWLDWALAMRNNFVHRPLRWSISPGEGQRCLPIDPDKTDIEVARDAGGFDGMLLTENVTETMGGIVVSTLELIETLCEQLVAVCLGRRDGSIELRQPSDSQWSDDWTASGFKGYAPGTLEVHKALRGAGKIVAPFGMAKRLASAGVTDDRRREVWFG